jgi:hypothetical protein
LAGKAFTSSAICDKPLICGHGTEKVNTCPTNQASNNRPVKEDGCGDVLLQGFWDREMECIVDFYITDMNANSYQAQDPVSILKSQENEKKWKYLTACLEECHHFTPFMVLTDRMMGCKASTFAKCLSAKLAEKW